MASHGEGEAREGLPHAAEAEWTIRQSTAETIAGLIFAGVAAYFLIAAQGFAHIGFSPHDPGPAAFPRTMGTLLLLCSVMLAVIGLRRRRTGIGDYLIGIARPLNVIAAAALTLFYAFAMPFATYYVATAIWFPLMLLLAGVYDWKSITAATVAIMLFAHLAFEVMLNINLP